MRSLIKIFASVLALSMFMSVASFAKTYPDVDSDADYAEAIDAISNLGIAKGDENGDFNADKTLTRAEGTAFVLRLLGLEEAAKAAAGTATDFSDVPPDHWAAGYVSVAAANGIVSGMGKGTFAPNSELTYAQIVRMLVSALGYESLASELGEWPGNYMSAASKIKLTVGITGSANDAVTRGTTARLIYAALTITKTERSDTDVSGGNVPASVDFDGKMFTVSKVSKTTVDDDDYTLLTGYRGGEEVQYMASDDKDITRLYGIKLSGAAIAKGAEIDVDDIKKGDILYISAGSDSVITTGVVYNNVLKPKGVMATATDIITGGNNKGGFVMGYVLGVNNSTVFLGTAKNPQFDSNNPGSAYSFTTSEGTLVTVYDSSKKNPLNKGTVSDITKNGTLVFVRLNGSGKAIEALVFVNSSEIQIENDETEITDDTAPENGGAESNISAKIDFNSNMFTVSKVSMTSVDDDDYTLLTGYQNGEEVQYFVSDDTDVTKLYEIDLTGTNVKEGAPFALKSGNKHNIKKGDIFFITAGRDNIISAAVRYDNVLNPAHINATATDIVTDGNNNGSLVAGYVLGVKNSEVFLGKAQNPKFDSNNPGSAYSFTISDSTLVTVYDISKKNPLDEGKVSDIAKNGALVFVRLNNSGKAIEVLALSDSWETNKVKDKSKTDNEDTAVPASTDKETDIPASIDFDGKMFIVSKVSKTTVDDDDYTLLTGYQNGEEVQYLASDDKDVTKLYRVNISGGATTKGTAIDVNAIKKGDMLYVTIGSDGIIVAGAVFNNAVKPTGLSDTVTGGFVAAYVLGTSGTKVYYGASQLSGFDTNNPGNKNFFTTSTGTLVTVYNKGKKKPLDEGTATDIDKNLIVFARLDGNGVATEVIVVID